MEKAELTAKFDGDTKRKHRYLGGVLGIDVAIYIDKRIDSIPKELVIKLSSEGGEKEG